jgi:hypothetical protein
MFLVLERPRSLSGTVQGHMAAAFRYWGKLGFGEGAAGHITVRDPVLPDHYWYSPCQLTCPIVFIISIYQDEPFRSAFLLHKCERLAYFRSHSHHTICVFRNRNSFSLVLMAM